MPDYFQMSLRDKQDACPALLGNKKGLIRDEKIAWLCLMFFICSVTVFAENWQHIIEKQNISDNCGKKALIIGIGKYKNADVSRLNGPKNDVEMMKKDFLEPILEYKPDEILVLTDNEATKAAIVSVMENWFLKGEAVKERFFYFSGHGSQIDDTPGGDEKDDRMDEVILTYNAEYNADDSLKKESIVIDDEIGKWFKSLSGKKISRRIRQLLLGNHEPGYRSQYHGSEICLQQRKIRRDNSGKRKLRSDRRHRAGKSFLFLRVPEFPACGG